jgi:long-chain acyl-CoA synthetase
MSTANTATESGFVPFHKILAAHAINNPNGVAFRVETQTLSWKMLHERVIQVAHALMASSIQPHDKVAVLGLPSLAYVECLFGTLAARACIVPLPVSASTETLTMMLADSGAKMLFVDPTVEAIVNSQIQTIRFGDNGTDGDEYTAWRATGARDRPLPIAQADDAFNIIYSSGTTGMPKGIVHLHGMRQRQAQRNGFGFGSYTRTLLSTPMYSNTTITPMMGTVANGGECILMRKFDTEKYLMIASTLRATHTMLVPVQYKRLLAHPAFDKSDLSAFIASQSTGAPMDAALKREILARWPGRFLEVYGLTEGGVSCFLEARQHPNKLDTVGKPAHGTEVFLIDEAGRKTNDGVGEVVGRSPFMMKSYHNRPEATAEIRWYDDEGVMYHRTGDIGRFDEDGFLTLLDRRKDVIISGGNNIYAADLEAVLMRHDDVQDCAVIGIPSEAWGETPMALVVTKPNTLIDAPALCAWANTQVGKTQRLASIELRLELPRSALGKLSKKELRAPYWKKENIS